MTTSNFTTTLLVDQTPEDVYNAINNVIGWWTAIEGNSQKLHDVFTVRFGEIFITHQVVESIPGGKVVWHVTDSSVQDWKDTRISFEITPENNATAVRFTHIGMHPGLEAYAGTEKGWNKFVKEGLFKLINQEVGVTA